MGPAKQKVKVPTVPSFISDELVKTLSADKQEYWANRKQGKRGQGDAPKLTKQIKTPDDVTIGFDNNGNMVAKTRAMRRRKPPTENKYTKATHSIKKARNK
jgi:hypothetical protein